MAYKTFVAGNPLSASDMNTYLMNQVVVDAPSTARPAGARIVYETDNDRFVYWNGTAWVPLYTDKGKSLSGMVGYTPTWTSEAGGNGSVGSGQLNGRYMLDGRYCDWSFALALGGGTSVPHATGVFNFALPRTVQATLPGRDPVIGSVTFFPASGNQAVGNVHGRMSQNGNQMVFQFDQGGGYATAAAPAAWQNGAVVTAAGRYEYAL